MLVTSLLLLIGIGCFEEAKSTTQEERMIPSVAGLEFDKVGFFVSGPPEYMDRLYARAMKQFTKAGLSQPDQSRPTNDAIATLMLTLDTIPLDESCPGKVLYVQKLELWEKVIPARNSNISVPSVTWSYAMPIPIIVDRVSIEQLETDLDRHLFEFIRSYKMGNSTKKK